MKRYLAVSFVGVLSRTAFTLVLPDGVVGFIMRRSVKKKTTNELLQGKLPALGWSSWNAYGCEVNDEKIKTAASELIDFGLKDVGYNYVNSQYRSSRHWWVY